MVDVLVAGCNVNGLVQVLLNILEDQDFAALLVTAMGWEVIG